MFLKQIGQVPQEEDLTPWIMLPPHTNIAACMDTIEYDTGDQIYYFSLTEMSNSGNMYKLIKNMKLQLGVTIPLSYMDTIYDCMIQLIIGMDFAHKNGLVHGSFGLHNVIVAKDGDSYIYKITHF